MWLHFCFSIVFVHVICTDSVKYDSKNINEHAEAIMAGVIKNISKVNNVLQELINNYEYLQKIYKSQENIESPASDDEIDEVYKNKNQKKPRALSKSEPSTNQPTPGYFAATQPIWENESKNINSESSESEEAETEITLEGKVPENISNNNEKIDPIHKPKEPAMNKAELNNPQTAEVISINTHKTTATVDKNKRTIEPNLTSPASKKSKTRHRKVSHTQYAPSNKDKMKSHHQPLWIKETNENDVTQSIKMKSDNSEPQENAKIDSQKRKVEKKIYSETFSQKNIWDEIINNKPIELEIHSEVVFDKVRKVDNKAPRVPLLRTKNTAFAVVTNENQTSDFKNVSTEIADSDDGISKEDFQAKVLREAYGDVCLKVVKKKCLKACKEAGKTVCQRFKCKSSYKSKYTELYKKGCMLHFDSNSGVIDGRKYETSIELVDMTREGYVRDCLPHILQENQRTSAFIKKKAPSNDSLDQAFPSLTNNFSVLRDRYEKECQKISHRKCRNACKYAYTNVCDSYPCVKGQKKAYNKACKTKCKSAFRSKRSKDSSSSSSGSDSDSDSD